jgi:hypothetical protein
MDHWQSSLIKEKKMRTRYYLKLGFKTGIKKFKLVIYLWLIVLILAMLAAAPLNYLLRINISHLFIEKPPFMPFELHLAEIFIANQNFFSPYFYFLFFLFLLVIVFSIFLNAGLFSRLITSESRITFSEFLADGSYYFGKFFLATLIYLPFFILLFALFRLLALPVDIFTEKAVSEWPMVIGSNLKILLFILLWTVFKLIFDLVRIIMIFESKKVLPALEQTFSFLKKHFFSLWGLYLILGLIFVVFSAIFLIVGRLLSSSQLFSLIITILLTQAIVIFRIFARTVFIGLEYCYYKENKI